MSRSWRRCDHAADLWEHLAERREAVTLLTLNPPDSLNAVNSQVLADFFLQDFFVGWQNHVAAARKPWFAAVAGFAGWRKRKEQVR